MDYSDLGKQHLSSLLKFSKASKRLFQPPATSRMHTGPIIVASVLTVAHQKGKVRILLETSMGLYIYLLCIHRVSKKLCQRYFLNKSVKHWPILIIFRMQHHD